MTANPAIPGIFMPGQARRQMCGHLSLASLLYRLSMPIYFITATTQLCAGVPGSPQIAD
jgi:hypothetical protein